MATWKQCIEYYEKAFDELHEYTNLHLKQGKDDDPLKNISIHILEKFHINLLNSIDLLKKVEEHQLNFLSLGLILRGMLSDIINYQYLKRINEQCGKEVFKGELSVLELGFVKAYKKMVDSEKNMAKDDSEKKVIEETFRKNFNEFYNVDVLKKDSDYRTNDFMNLVKVYQEKGIRLDTETGKVRFANSENTEVTLILFSYLSQLQHFSGRGYNFYKTKEYSVFNPRFTLMLLFLTICAIFSIVEDLMPDTKTLKKLFALAKEVNEL